MKSKQVGIVLIGLIAIGLAGLIIRVVSAGDDEIVLSGLFPITQEAVDTITITSGDEQTVLSKFSEGDWRVDGQYNAFPPKLDQFWRAVKDITEDAQLVSTNPAFHERIGVSQDDATRVVFSLGRLDQETFYVGKWEPTIRLCYLRRQGQDDVYAIPCTRPDVFDPVVDGWRNPVILSVPRTDLDSLEFIYPDEQFSVRFLDANNWVVVSEDGQQPANRTIVDFILSIVEQRLIARGFATDAETSGLNFAEPDAAIRLVTRGTSNFPTIRLRFIERDDVSYYVSTPDDPTVFILSKDIGDSMLVPKAQLVR